MLYIKASHATRRKKSCRKYSRWNRAAQTSNHHQLALSSACFLLADDSAVNLDKNESKMKEIYSSPTRDHKTLSKGVA